MAKAKPKTAKKPVAEPKRNLASFLRKLRPMMPGEVVKSDKGYNPGYVIGGKVKIEVRYVCRWSSSSDREQERAKAEKERYPLSVKIEHVNNFIRAALDQRYSSWNSSAVYRTRTFNRNKNGDINIDSIGAAIQQCSKAVDDFIARKKKQESDEKAETDRLEAEIKRLEAFMPISFSRSEGKRRRRTNSLISKADQCVLTVFSPERNDEGNLLPFKYNLEFGSSLYDHQLTQDQLETLLKTLNFVAK